ncbi:NPCBM/NEW2 domain-containing protein [Fontivita pretiosa]|uniref:NPCBM/NEW2 domain-containing protein n=1 Tax=Fontivita pretiosa TaxID=2989684 RepID=UPI003D174A8E
MSGNRRADGRLVILEFLELRKLLSTLSVMDFGAVPDGAGGDDSAAIRAAIDASAPGDTIYFPAGVYDIGSTIYIKGDRIYRGDGNAELKAPGHYHIFKVHVNNVRIEGLSFDGKPIFLDRDGGLMNENIVINDNTFKINAAGENWNGITFTTGLRNSRITNNTFGPINGDNGIYGYAWDNLVIANNEFLNGNEGIHVIDNGNISRNLLVEQNYFSGLRRMGIEYQGGGYNSVFQDNYYENPVLTPNFSDNNSVFAYSLIADRSTGTVARRNTSIAPQRPDGTGVRVIFEIGGDNALVEENFSVDGNHVLSANDFHQSTSVLARNNRWYGYRIGPSGRGLTLQNNGEHVRLSWNVDRGKPGRNRRLGLQGYVDDQKQPSRPAGRRQPITPAGEEPSSRPEQVNDSKAVSSFVYLSDLKWESASNGWGPVELDRANGEKRAGDGDALTIDGRVYSKGIGVAVESEIVYRLDGKYSRFFSDIGVDDQAGDGGSVTFQVWADGKKIYDSDVMTGRDGKKVLSLKVRGVRELKLVTTNAGDGDNDDHADWAAARLVPVFRPTPDPGVAV